MRYMHHISWDANYISYTIYCSELVKCMLLVTEQLHWDSFQSPLWVWWAGGAPAKHLLSEPWPIPGWLPTCRRYQLFVRIPAGSCRGGPITCSSSPVTGVCIREEFTAKTHWCINQYNICCAKKKNEKNIAVMCVLTCICMDAAYRGASSSLFL